MHMFSDSTATIRTDVLDIWVNRPDHHFGPRFYLMYVAA